MDSETGRQRSNAGNSGVPPDNFDRIAGVVADAVRLGLNTALSSPPLQGTTQSIPGSSSSITGKPLITLEEGCVVVQKHALGHSNCFSGPPDSIFVTDPQRSKVATEG